MELALFQFDSFAARIIRAEESRRSRALTIARTRTCEPIFSYVYVQWCPFGATTLTKISVGVSVCLSTLAALFWELVAGKATGCIISGAYRREVTSRWMIERGKVSGVGEWFSGVEGSWSFLRGVHFCESFSKVWLQRFFRSFFLEFLCGIV